MEYNPDANLFFPAKAYLNRFKHPENDPMKVHAKFLNAWHLFYQKYGCTCTFNSSKCLLEFGGGPTIYSLISASKYIGSITFADYAETNRAEITLWRDKKTGCQ